MNLREQLENIDGLGEKAINSFVNYFSNEGNRKESFAILDMIEIKEIENNYDSLNKSILFTGTLQKMSRDRAKELAKKKGYKIASNVSKNLDILVYGEKSGSKLKKAKDLKINILNEKDFLNLIN
jgi:DNA ligase (NAD+)